jgi:uncharacterized protein
MSLLQQTYLILGLAFVIGLALGASMQLSHFCTMGAIADVVLFKNFQRLKLWVLAVAVALVGTQSLAALGWINLEQSVYNNGQIMWLSYIVGGLCFGVGMVLAGGCVSKNLLRVATGNLKAAMVLVVLGLSAAMTVRGIFSPVRINVLEGFVVQTPNLLSAYLVQGIVSPFIVSIFLGLSLMVFALYKRQDRTVSQISSGLIMGGLVVLLWVVSGTLGYIPEHPDTLQAAVLSTASNKVENVLPIAAVVSWLNYLLLFSDSSQLITFGMAIVLGIFLGALCVSLYQNTFHWQSLSAPKDLIQHLFGAVLMGFGGVVAMGCSISHSLGGVSALSIGALLTCINIAVGAVFTLKYLEYAD